jgi:ferredoxin
MPKVIHDIVKCIGCGACAAVCPEFWEMGDEGKSILKGSKPIKEGGEAVKSELKVKDVGCNKEAADSCPVDAIIIE